MRIECENCHDVVEVTAKTVVAPFICSVCVNDAAPSPTPAFVPCGNPGCDDCADKMCDANDMVDGESFPCDTATVENTTLLIEDLQQQLADERAQTKEIYSHINDELVIARQNFLEAHQQIQNQADLIKQQEGNIDQDLTTIAGLLKDRSRLAAQAEALGKEKFEINRAAAWLLGAWFALIEENDKLVSQAKCLDDRCNRQRNSITMYQEQEETLTQKITNLNKMVDFWKRMTETWTRRAEGARDLAIARKGIIADLKRHPIREYFRNAWSS